jgi:predicted HD superfamily hydrolase involved in NAD metabolism
VRVARCADVLAQRHGLDAGKARTAGMLHDLARLYAPARLLAECTLRDMRIDEFERANPMVLHARLGAAIARERFGIEDDEILSAMAKHTTAAGRMSPLDCVVYLADSLEPARTFPERRELWELARRDLRAAMRETLLTAFRHHARKGKVPAPAMLAAARAFGIDPAAVSLEVHASAS